MGRFRELHPDLPLAVAWFATGIVGAWIDRPDLSLPVAVVATWVTTAALAGAVVLLRDVLFAWGKAREARPGAGSEWALAAWVLPPLPMLGLVRSEFGAWGLVALIVLSKLGDIAGYYVGNAIGKSHPFPNTSPGKTTAGCVASLVAGTLGGVGCVALGWLPEGRLGLMGGLVAGAIVNVAAQAGDLLESKAKRWAGVKDSGSWFGPSGGVLDLVDSLLLSVPAACLTWPLLFPGP